MRKRILNPAAMFIIGLLLGAACRLLDIYTKNAGEIFSQMAIWILLGTLISIYSKTEKSAMINILLFCLGMLITYYTVAILTKGVYSTSYIIGWTIFALCTPMLAFLAWKTKEKGIFPKIISCSIIIVSILSGLILFDGLRVYDFMIDGLLCYFLFVRKIER